MGYACGDFSPQVRPVEGFDLSIDINRLEMGLVFYVPPNLEAPDQVEEIGVPGNRFLLRGYYYYEEIHGKRLLKDRFDLLGWKPMVPFERWKSGGETEILPELNSKYDRYENPVPNSSEEFRVARKYSGC